MRYAVAAVHDDGNVLPEAYNESTAWIAAYMTGTLKVSNMLCGLLSRFALACNVAVVNHTGAPPHTAMFSRRLHAHYQSKQLVTEGDHTVCRNLKIDWNDNALTSKS